jgi:iron(III) transport system substrate-binding protein
MKMFRNMKKISWLLFTGVLLLSFACGDAPGGQSNNPEVDNRPPGLRLLTWRYLAQDAEIVKKFEQRYRTKVAVSVKPMAEIVATAASGQALNADVVIVPSLEDATRLRGFGALQPFFVDKFTNGDVADRYLDNEGYYAGLTRWTMAAVYNPNAVTSEEAGSYRGIASLPLRGIRLGMAHPDSSGFAGIVSSLYTTVNPDAAALWAKVMYERSVGLPNGSDYDQMDRLLAGDLDIAFVSSGNAVRWFLNGNPVHYEAGGAWRVRFPQTEASGVNFYNMTCVTMAANAPNRNMAMTFINYLYEPENQRIMSDAWFEFPCETFSETNSYLYGIPDRIGLAFSAERTEEHISTAWQIINQIANSQTGLEVTPDQ